MAPRETPKSTMKIQRPTNVNVKDVPTKGRASPVGAIKKILVKKTVDKTPLKSKF